MRVLLVEDDTEITYTRGEGLDYKDEFGNVISVKDGYATINSKKVNLGEGKEPILLGNTTKEFLNKVLTAISSITVATSLGVMPIINKAQVELLKKDLESLLSKISNTD